MIDLVFDDGVHHIQLDGVLMPLHDVPKLCTDGFLDDCQGFYKVVQWYVDHTEVEQDNAVVFMPLFRQMVAVEVVRWVSLKYGVAEWRHRQVRMPLDASVVRTALMHQIEGALATIKEVESLSDKACTFYQSMLGLPHSNELSQFGQEVVTDMLDTLLDGFIEDGLEIPARH